jgi:murein tripeptide amidase MpaA
MDLLVIGDANEDKLVCWVIARQHPGESMAEWWMEGFLDRILDPDDPVSRDLLSRAVFYVVPNMNPDGSRRGHLRTNAVGTNLNRAWAEPSMETSPEVFLVRQKMHQTGVDFALDVHGDEALPYNFIAGAEGIADWSQRQDDLTEQFKSAYCLASPDFQTEHGYPRDEANSSDLRKCTDYLAQSFDCLSMTLEMPFKDTCQTPDADQGWSPNRCRILGGASLDALSRVIDHLR